MANEKTNKKNVEVVVDMDEIPQIELEKIDVTPYIGKKVQVLDAKVIETQFGRAIKFETEVIANVGTDDKPNFIKATKLLGLHQDKNSVWGIAKDSKAQEFFDKYKLKSHKDMLGKVVIVQTTESKNGSQFLTFN
jgi:hypothetical protein